MIKILSNIPRLIYNYKMLNIQTIYHYCLIFGTFQNKNSYYNYLKDLVSKKWKYL